MFINLFNQTKLTIHCNLSAALLLKKISSKSELGIVPFQILFGQRKGDIIIFFDANKKIRITARSESKMK